jgi:excisionase family DNA binding protein
MSEKLIQEIRELKELTKFNNMLTKDWLTIDEAAVYLSVSKSLLYKLNSSSNPIPFSKPTEGRIYYRRIDLDNWLEKGLSTSLTDNAKLKPRKKRGSNRD